MNVVIDLTACGPLTPTLILLPGLDGTGALFDPLMAAVTSDAPLQVISYPDAELLTYSDLVELVRPQLPERCVLVAESFSGPVGIRLASDPRVLALALCNSFASPPRAAFLRHFVSQRWLALPAPEWVIRQFLVGRDASPDLVSKVSQTLKCMSPAVAAARLRAVLGVDEREALRRCNKPVLYLRGSEDRLVKASAVDEIRTLLPSVEVRSIAGPHFLLQARPVESWAAIVEFLAKTVAN